MRNGNVLLMRRAKTGYRDGEYGLPSGHLESNETLRSGMVREVREETGIVLSEEHLVLATTLHRREDDDRVDFYFTVSEWEGEPMNNEPDKCDAIAWFPLDKLPDNTIPYIRQAIECVEKGVMYSEWGW